MLTGLVLVVVRLVRRETLQQAVSGFFGIALAAFLASRTKGGKGFFLPGIFFSGLYGVAFLVSVLIRRPLVGVIVAAVEGRGPQWREDAVLRRVYSIATLGWVGVFALRVGVQGALYLSDARDGWLAAAKLGLGYPVTIVAVALTVAYIRRVTRRATAAPPPGVPEAAHRG